MSNNITPFSNGTQVTIWKESNCHECRKCGNENGWGCSIERDLDIDGEISQAKAKQVGYKPGQSWECALKDSVHNPPKARSRKEKKNENQLELF